MDHLKHPDVTSQVDKRSPEEQRQESVSRILRLVKEINERGEILVFPGIDPKAYQRMKADEGEFPDLVTPIDELLQRLESEGMKVVLGKHPEAGNVFILPSKSDDLRMDSIAPHQLLIENVACEELKELIGLTNAKK